MPSAPTVETRVLPSLPFAPVELSLDDRLPADIRLLVGFRGLIEPDTLSDGLTGGLRAFPHLTGRLAGTVEKPQWLIEPSEGGVLLEAGSLPGKFAVGDWETFTAEEHTACFMPGEAVAKAGRPLFQARLTLLPDSGLSMIGLRVSHLAVDGTGLALFIAHCTAAGRGTPAPPVFHARNNGFGENLEGPEELPRRYLAAGDKPSDWPWESDHAAQASPVLFAVSFETVAKRLAASSLLDARLRLGAWLCAKLAELHHSFSEVALWCDPRGLNGIPPTYTGNSGCYLHFPLRGVGAEGLTRELRAVATRAGFLRIADTSRRIKLAESQGREVCWDGPGSDVLQLNLVPHAVLGCDFGAGLPVFGLMLSRNSSGLRLSVTPDGKRFLVEACLPENLGEALAKAVREESFQPVLWGCGRDVSRGV